MKDNIPLFEFWSTKADKPAMEVFVIEKNPNLSQIGPSIVRRDSFYGFFYFTGGKGTFYIDFKAYPFGKNTVFFVAPGQVLQWLVKEKPCGFAVPFMEQCFYLFGNPKFMKAISLFELTGGVPKLILAGPENRLLKRMLRDMLNEYRSEEANGPEMLISMLQTLLITCQRFAVRRGIPKQPDTAAARMVSEFRKLLNSDVLADQTIGYYADKLGVTLNHLCETVRMNTGQTAGEMMHKMLALEASRLLAHTDMTAAEIAHKLNFSEASYFGRFFKRQTGFSPGDFRASIHNKSHQ